MGKKSRKSKEKRAYREGSLDREHLLNYNIANVVQVSEACTIRDHVILLLDCRDELSKIIVRSVMPEKNLKEFCRQHAAQRRIPTITLPFPRLAASECLRSNSPSVWKHILKPATAGHVWTVVVAGGGIQLAQVAVTEEAETVAEPAPGESENGGRPEDEQHRLDMLNTCRQQVVEVVRETRESDAVAFLVDLRDPVGASIARVAQPDEKTIEVAMDVCKRGDSTPAIAFTGPVEMARDFLSIVCPGALHLLNARVRLGYTRCLVVAAGGILVTGVRVTDLSPENLN